MNQENNSERGIIGKEPLPEQSKKVTVKRGKAPKELLIQQIDIRPIVRTRQDIATWRQALLTAENVYFPKRTLLYNLYYDLLLDAHLSAVIDKRKLAVINTQITYTENGKENDKITKLIQGPWFIKMLSDLLDSKFWGFSLIEFQFLPDEIIPDLIPRKHVMPEKSYVLKYESDVQGLNYNEPPYCNYTISAGEPKDLGLMLKAAQYVIMKRGGFGDWAQFAEIFGMPFRKFTYEDYNEAARQQLEFAAKESGSCAYAIIPKGADIEFIENNSTGSNDLYKSLIQACNSELSKLILGQTLTTEQGDKGARSLGDVHEDIEQQYHLADRLFVKNILNYQFKQLLQIHGYITTDEGEFDFLDMDAIDLTDRISIDTAVAKMVPISDDYFYDKYGIPKPENYDELKAKQEAQKQVMQKLTLNNNNDAEEKQPAKDKVKVPDNKNLKGFVNHVKSFF